MIQFHRSAFGLNLLFRVHGSAVFRGAVMGLLSVLCLVVMHRVWTPNNGQTADELNHPYALGVLVATLTFLLVFRAQSAYARYWEACGSVYQMMSKWIDAITHAAIYHLQCDHFKHVKPPAYYDYPHLNQHYLTRERERGGQETTKVETERISDRATVKSIEEINRTIHRKPPENRKRRKNKKKGRGPGGTEVRGEPEPLHGEPRLDGGWSTWFDDDRTTYIDLNDPEKKDIKGFASMQGGRTPSLFLQELAHLGSLAIAVALSTLRNDVEGAESPLDIFIPGSKWPAVDPNEVEDYAFNDSFLERLLFFLGMGRTTEQRTRYNASRPLKVIGGVSDAEIRFLQMARGPYAKTQLCWQWLSEFLIREHLAGTLGKVGPPIVSRCFQFLGDGMIYYNHARKIMFIPFPFPHSQLSALYVLVAVPAIAFLMDQYCEHLWVGCVLTFLTVTALSGIHEVARELENPFRNVPNEIPLATLMAEANEALLTMYAGYHPDLFWADAAKQYTPDNETVQENKTATTTINNTKKSRDDELDEKIHQLMKKIEEQSREIDQLKSLGDEKKIE